MPIFANTMAKLVLFDIDGTLVRTGRAGVKAFALAFKTEFGIAEGADKLKFAGRTDMSLIREFFGVCGIEASRQNFDRFIAAYLGHLQETIVSSAGEVCPGILEFMRELRTMPEPPAIGLLTGNLRRGAEIKLGRFDLWREFPFGGFADDHEERDCIAAIARRRGVEHLKRDLHDHEVVVIGDTPLDIRCARAIKAKVIAVATGGHSVDELKAHQPDWLLESFDGFSAREIFNATAK